MSEPNHDDPPVAAPATPAPASSPPPTPPADPSHTAPPPELRRPLTGHAIIAGWGLPGRAIAEALERQGIPFCVIERNIEVVRRCLRGGVHIIPGDATAEPVLVAAGIERAVLFAATMPSDTAVLEAVSQARRINRSIRIVARTEYVSTGLKATRRGANEVVVAEQVVATEFARLARLANEPLPQAPPPPPPMLSTPPEAPADVAGPALAEPLAPADAARA